MEFSREWWLSILKRRITYLKQTVPSICNLLPAIDESTQQWVVIGRYSDSNHTELPTTLFDEETNQTFTMRWVQKGKRQDKRDPDDPDDSIPVNFSPEDVADINECINSDEAVNIAINCHASSITGPCAPPCRVVVYVPYKGYRPWGYEPIPKQMITKSGRVIPIVIREGELEYT